MKRAIADVAAMIVLITLLIPAIAVADQAKASNNSLPPQSQSISIWRVRRALVAAFATSYSYSYIDVIDRGSFRFDSDSFEFDATLRNKKREHFKVDLKNLVPVFPKRGALGHCRVKDEAGRDLPAPLNRLMFTEENAAAFSSAINRLRELSATAVEAKSAFTRQAAAWRALPSKPPIPEEIRVHRLLAENAIQEKKPEEALDQYETGLELHPTWPQGYFNAALIAAELGYHAEAVEHMQSYLELVPDAPDAPSARDQIVIWQHTAKRATPEKSSQESRK